MINITTSISWNRRFLTFSILLLTFLVSTYGEDKPNRQWLINIDSSATTWGNNQFMSTEMTSQGFYGQSKWKTWGYKSSIYQSEGLITGMTVNPLRDITATLTSLSAIPYKIDEIAALLTIDGEIDHVKSVAIAISKTGDFDNENEYEKIEAIKQGQGTTYWVISIKNPSINQYYQFQITYDSYKDSWIHLHNLYFYEAEPAVTCTQNANNSNNFTFLATKGDLHMLASKFDLQGRFVGNVDLTSGAQKVITKAESDDSVPSIFTDDAEWTNKVADVDTPYVLSAPDEYQHYIQLRAKYVTVDGQHSDEETFYIHSTGILTGLEQINASLPDSQEAEAIWFNLQGQQVDNPTRGLFIRVQGNKAEKVLL